MNVVEDMMRDGTLCAGCGVFLGRSVGTPVKCKNCVFKENTGRAITMETAITRWQNEKFKHQGSINWNISFRKPI